MSNADFRREMQNVTDEIISRLISNMNSACLVVERKAKMLCPVDQGQLRASIFSQVDLEEGKIIGRVGSNLEYAPYVHQGTGIYAVNGDGRLTPWGYTVESGRYQGFHWTRGQRPNPFLDKAKLQEKDNVVRILGGVENA